MTKRRKTPSTREPLHHGVRITVVTHPTSYTDIVRLYLDIWKPRLDAELDSYSQQPSLAQAVARAGRALAASGKKHAHQARLSTDTLTSVSEKLNPRELAHQVSFHELHESVRSVIADIRGVGKLMIYDTALRIGAKRGLMPEFVYLHRGTMIGAHALGLDYRCPHLSKDAFPPPFSVLQPHEIEDCICIFKDELRAIRPRPR